MPDTQNQHSSEIRGQIKKSHYNANVLAGFMDEPHFRAFAEPYIKDLNPQGLHELDIAFRAARASVTGLSQVDISNAEIRFVDESHLTAIRADGRFQNAFGNANPRFSWVDLRKLIAVQAYVRAGTEAVPSIEVEQVAYALPNDWSVPAEINMIPPGGPIYVTTSSPHFNGVEIKLEGSLVTLQPSPHVNLIQVANFNGKYFLRNGYHRIVGALSAGLSELPALVTDAFNPEAAGLLHMGTQSFNPIWLCGIARPPLVSDFSTDATITIPMREMRFGLMIGLTMSPIAIGV